MNYLKAKDPVTAQHILRTKELVTRFSMYLNFSPTSIFLLRLLAEYHDIGKVSIPVSILSKPGPLNSDEISLIRQHSETGHRIVKSCSDLAPIADLVLKHHEHWDGNGYPLGLKGESIPIECRILGIVDAYEAMTSNRPYRKAKTHEQAKQELINYSGTQFDSAIVNQFLEMFF
ncbi:MAG: phosphohydrolase [Firmicutes bacterium HGW-Firmicutes-12]|jgi:HD-GYP domain-containing protein (c-di-GMP phosphodiesterase class II)|nr:MAG: phosphohydrolase [Firmicutes bacterium HGW-Firmicutes-12]